MRSCFVVATLVLVSCSAGGHAADDYGRNTGDAGAEDAAPADASNFVCADEDTRCTGSAFERCSGNAFHVVEACTQACDPNRGCVVCVPETGTCDGDISHRCNADGTGYEDVLCDSVQGMTCDPNSGRCVGACSPDELGKSYIGCEYFPTVTAQAVDIKYSFGVAIANASATTAHITIDGAGMEPRSFDVPSADVHTEPLPWVGPLKLCTNPNPTKCRAEPNAVIEKNGAYHLRSDQPVTVYQFSPLDAAAGVSNDASLLLPSNVLTGNYVTAAWPWFMYTVAHLPGLIAVTAVEDNSQVTVASTVSVAAGTGTSAGPAFPAGVPTTGDLVRGDVRQLTNASGDLTGSSVTSNKRVQVIGGHFCAFVPLDKGDCDHLEESMFPIETLDTDYLVTAPAIRIADKPDAPREEFVRIVAALPGTTTITYDPPIPGALTTLSGVGQFIEIEREVADFAIHASQRVLVAQYIEGKRANEPEILEVLSDPSISLAVPTAQYRLSYLFHAPINYATNFVNIVARTGSTVTLDNQTITAFTPVGSTDFGVARVALDDGPGGDGNHKASSGQSFGITVYGYDTAVSYWYPGGLDLAYTPIK